jgi:hypothetical protein
MMRRRSPCRRSISIAFTVYIIGQRLITDLSPPPALWGRPHFRTLADTGMVYAAFLVPTVVCIGFKTQPGVSSGWMAHLPEIALSQSVAALIGGCFGPLPMILSTPLRIGVTTALGYEVGGKCGWPARMRYDVKD